MFPILTYARSVFIKEIEVYGDITHRVGKYAIKPKFLC
jgi:hypothetical protein